MGYTNAFVWVMIFFLHQSVIFWEFDEKNWLRLELLEKNFSPLPVPKIKFDLPQQCKSTLVFIFWIFH